MVKRLVKLTLEHPNNFIAFKNLSLFLADSLHRFVFLSYDEIDDIYDNNNAMNDDDNILVVVLDKDDDGYSDGGDNVDGADDGSVGNGDDINDYDDNK